MKKIYLILFCNLLVFCLAMLFAKVTFASQYESYLKYNNSAKAFSGVYQSDGKALDVDSNLNSEGTEFPEYYVDFREKTYEPGKITVNDSSFVISSALQTKILDNISSFGTGASFLIVNLKDGMSIGYNVDRSFETASSIKAPYALYVYREIAKGNIDPNMMVTYQAKHYNKGTGITKNSPFGTEFSVAQLLYNSLHYSDNVAHTMLHSTFGVKGYNDMLDTLGVEKLHLTIGNPWGYTNARSAAIVWQDIYNFSLENEYGIEMFNILSNNQYSYFKKVRPDLPSAGKAGFAYTSVLENGVIFDQTPYLAMVNTNVGGNWSADDEVIKLISFVDEIMQEYYAYLASTP